MSADEQDPRWNDKRFANKSPDVKFKNINRELNSKNTAATQEELEHSVLDTLAEELENIRKDANKVHQANTKGSDLIYLSKNIQH